MSRYLQILPEFFRKQPLSRKNANYLSNIYGLLLAKTFWREHGQLARFTPLAKRGMIKDTDRPFLIANATVNYRRPDSFSVTQECFEMTQLYTGSRSLGYVHAKDLMARKKAIRIRDVIAMSGAAMAFHLPALGGEIAGMGLSREVVNYAKDIKSKSKVEPSLSWPANSFEAASYLNPHW